MSKAEYRSAIRSRRMIKEAFADLLQEKPLDRITVTDIVNHAQINRGTFYAHYADIPDLIQHLINDTFTSIQEVIPASPDSTPDVPTQLLNRVQTILEADYDFYQKIMSSSASTLMHEQLVNVVLDYMLQQEPIFPTASHESYAFMIRFCAGGLSNLYKDWFAGKIPISLDELTARSTQLLNDLVSSWCHSHPDNTSSKR